MRTSFGALKTPLAMLGFLFVALDCSSRDGASMAAPSAAPSVTLPAPSGAPVKEIPPLSPNARTEDERNTIDVFQQAALSTVFVTQKRVAYNYFGQQSVQEGSGTGFIWDTDGHVVTNYHVVERARVLSVTLKDHRSFPATIVGVEPRKDIAVLKIGAPKDALHPIRVPEKTSAALVVGQKAIAIGNPFGLDQTLTTGVVSAIGREVQGKGGFLLRDMVQTDAAINPGNSGGPLLDSSGRLIGMNTMIYSASGASAGIGFAVPVATIARVVPQIIRTGRAEQVGLGVQIDPNQRLEQLAGLRGGVIVLDVVPGTPAAKAGLRGVKQDENGITLGDVIVAVDGKRVEDYSDLYNVLDLHRPGEKARVTIVRDKKAQDIEVETVALGAGPGATP